MATVKGFIRSYGAAVRKAERAQQRAARESAKRFKEQQKQEEIRNATQAVKDWNEYVNMLQSVHKNCTEHIDWDQILVEPRPKEPVLSTKKEDAAKFARDFYKPTFLSKITGEHKRKKMQLDLAIKYAKEDDLKLYQKELQELEDWDKLQSIARGVNENKIEAYIEAIQYFDPFSDLSELGTKIDFVFNEKSVNINLHSNSIEIIPDFILTQTSTGKLSKRNMSKTSFHELYQDHVCSSVIRVAREMFAYLPLEYARINALSNLLNTRTGHLEEQPILSVVIPHKTLDQLNLENIDPSDSMINFLHNMSFKKTSGFEVVELVEFEN